MGAPVMAFCRIDDKEIRLREPVARARCADRPGSDPVAPGRRIPTACRPAATSSLNSNRSFDELGTRPSSCSAPARLRALTVPATELALQACRPPGAERGAAGRLRRRSAASRALDSVVARDPRRSFPGEDRRGATSPPRRAAYDARAAPAAAEEAAMLKQIEGSRADRRGDRALPARGDLRLSRSRLRPTSSKGLGEMVRDRRARRTASSSTSSPSSPRCRSRSAPRRPARAPTPRPRARACCSWRRRSTTPPAWACRSS